MHPFIHSAMALLSLALLGVIIAIVISLAAHAIRERRSYFSRRSIPTPPIPSLFLGHLGTLWTTRLPSDQFYRWTKQYGSVYGLFEGFRPMLVTSDVNFVEEVFVKQFARFPARRRALLTRALGEKRENLFSAHSLPVWRRQRKILQPVFGGLKMKRLVPTIETCMNVFMVKLSETVDTTPVIDMCELYKRATMDVICRCAFSIDTGVQSDADRQNIYMKKVGELFAHDPELTLVAKLHRITSHTVLAYVSMVLFHVRRLIHGKGMSLQANLWLLEHMHEFIQQRLREMATGSSGNDLVQLMVDAVQSEKESLTSGELLSNVFIVLVAGFETTSTTLAYSTYRLALHQDIQQQLYEELVEHPSLDAESIGKLTTLELFVREVLRMHPPAPLVIDRQCEEDTHIAGHDIPKGMLIKVDVLSIHYDQDLWGPEPVDEFCMDRHREKRHPMAWIPFGAGPRICVGMSFALMEVKLCLARLIKTYRILPPSSEPFELDISEQITRTPEKVCVRLEKRIEVDAQS